MFLLQNSICISTFFQRQSGFCQQVMNFIAQLWFYFSNLTGAAWQRRSVVCTLSVQVHLAESRKHVACLCFSLAPVYRRHEKDRTQAFDWFCNHKTRSKQVIAATWNIITAAFLKIAILYICGFYLFLTSWLLEKCIYHLEKRVFGLFFWRKRTFLLICGFLQTSLKLYFQHIHHIIHYNIYSAYSSVYLFNFSPSWKEYYFFSEGKYGTWNCCGNNFLLKSSRLTHIPLAAAIFEQITDGDDVRENNVCFWWFFKDRSTGLFSQLEKLSGAAYRQSFRYHLDGLTAYCKLSANFSNKLWNISFFTLLLI